MISFDGTYRLYLNDAKPPWIGKSDKPAKARQKGNAWRVRIIDLSISRPQVRHIKPRIVFATPYGEGIFKSNCANSLGRRIFRDFALDVTDVLWVEQFPDMKEPIRVAVFSPLSQFGPDIHYAIEWRPIRPNELKTLLMFLPESEIASKP